MIALTTPARRMGRPAYLGDVMLHARAMTAVSLAAASLLLARTSLPQQPTTDTSVPAGRVVATIARVHVVGGDAVRAAWLDKTIAVDLDDVPLARALETIARAAGLKLAYQEGPVTHRHQVSLHAASITVEGALLVALNGTALDAVLLPTGELLLTPHGRTKSIHQTAGTIAGRVTDAATQSPLDHVSVRVEGPGLGAATVADGRYAIHDIPPGPYHVTARRVGYTPLTKTVAVLADSTVVADFVLAAAPTRLNEMVTTAVGDQRRYEVGNVISTINADSIAPTAPITSLTDLISARAPGVEVLETSGITGSGEAIRIRGASSLVLQSDPIVIVDGVRQDNSPGGSATTVWAGGNFAQFVPAPSRLNDLDFSDVASIDVLKGPAASTEYGTDAANGVIVITTKRGTAGRSQWRVSAEQGGSNIPESFPTLYYSWGHTTDASRTPVECPLFAFGDPYQSSLGTCALDSLTAWNPLNHPYYSIFGSGSRQKYELSAGGGSDAIRYFITGGLSNETGILRLPGAFRAQADALGLPGSALTPNGENQRTARGNTAVRLGPTADLTMTAAYLSTYQETANPFLLAGIINTSAIADSAHNYGYGPNSSGFANPVYEFGNVANQNTDRLTGGVTANWRPLSWFVAHGTAGIDHGSQRTQAAILPQIANLSYWGSQLGINNAVTDIYTIDLRTSMTATLPRAARAVTSLGLQMADTRTQGTTAMASGISTTNFTLNGATNAFVGQLGNRQATLGGYAEEELGLADRLFIAGALRVDAGSGFGGAYSTAVYPKASLSWLAVSNGAATVRLRGAFGESGVQPPNGAALPLYTPTTVWLHGAPSSTVGLGNVANPGLQPERSAEYEGGVDVGLWQNRVSVELTGYSKTTRDALVSVGTGWELGNYPYEENVGNVRNSGVEAAVTATLIGARELTWDISLNASANHNKLVSLAPGVPSQPFNGYLAVLRFAAGYPLYGYWAPRITYSDSNHDGVIQPAEVTVASVDSYAGSDAPTQEASVGSHLGLWGGAVAVNALLDYRGGFRLLNSGGYLAFQNGHNDYASNVPRAPLWEQARDVGAEIVDNAGLDGYAPVAPWYEDATYVRFRELAVTYAVPRRVARAARVQSLSVTGAVRNLALWTRYTGPDPEVTNATSPQYQPTSNTFLINHDIRDDYGAVPLLRYWVVRLNLGL